MLTTASSVWESARPLIDIAGRYPLEGTERSFRLSHSGLVVNRFLFGIDTRHISSKKLISECEHLNMPRSFISMLNDNLPHANQIGFGFEGMQEHCSFRVYLEFWEQVKKQVFKTGRTPLTLHTGYKWNPADPLRKDVAHYVCFPLLTPREIIDRSTSLFDSSLRNALPGLVKNIVERCTAANNPSFIYSEVNEDNGPRASFDINLYKSGLTIAAIRHYLLAAAPVFNLAQSTLGTFLDTIDNNFLGHLAGGSNSTGRSFVTVYYEDNLPT